MSILSFIYTIFPLQTFAVDTAEVQSVEKHLQSLTKMPANEVVTTILHDVINVGKKLLIALVAYYIGRWVIKRIIKLIGNIMDRRNVDVSLRSFTKSFIGIVLTVLLIIIIVGTMGADLTSIIAIFASAGLALGIALSGTLQNFAGGVMILLFRPFRVGHFIEAQGESGTVKEIQLINTVINTPDNKTILLPNGSLSTGIINNYSRETDRRVEWTFGISYGDDYDKAKKLIIALIDKDSRVHKDPEPFVALSALADSAVNIVVRAWTSNPDFWNVFYDLNENVYKTFNDNNLNIPYPQMDIHISNPEVLNPELMKGADGPTGDHPKEKTGGEGINTSKCLDMSDRKPASEPKDKPGEKTSDVPS